jgi:hypothetical protein
LLLWSVRTLLLLSAATLLLELLPALLPVAVLRGTVRTELSDVRSANRMAL